MPAGVLSLRVTGRIIVSLYDRASDRVSALQLIMQRYYRHNESNYDNYTCQGLPLRPKYEECPTPHRLKWTPNRAMGRWTLLGGCFGFFANLELKSPSNWRHMKAHSCDDGGFPWNCAQTWLGLPANTFVSEQSLVKSMYFIPLYSRQNRSPDKMIGA